MINDAFPVLSKDAEPNVVVPSVNVTAPDGTPAPPPEAATVAVRVTAWP
jgi:hypothetical protein